MKRRMRSVTAAAAVLLYLLAVGDRWSEGRAQSLSPTPAPADAQTAGATPISPQRALINQYCLGCHSDRLRSGGLALSALNLDAPGNDAQSAEVGEKVIRKLRGGLMPPAGARRPDIHATAEFVSWLENKIDTTSTETGPGRVGLRRLNRREYGYAVRDLLGLDIDAKAWLPDDNVKGNFDNNAAALQVSPTFLDQSSTPRAPSRWRRSATPRRLPRRPPTATSPTW
jgi:mono/diheme cytochrome c family protein